MLELITRIKADLERLEKLIKEKSNSEGLNESPEDSKNADQVKNKDFKESDRQKEKPFFQNDKQEKIGTSMKKENRIIMPNSIDANQSDSEDYLKDLEDSPDLVKDQLKATSDYFNKHLKRGR